NLGCKRKCLNESLTSVVLTFCGALKRRHIAQVVDKAADIVIPHTAADTFISRLAVGSLSHSKSLAKHFASAIVILEHCMDRPKASQLLRGVLLRWLVGDPFPHRLRCRVLDRAGLLALAQVQEKCDELLDQLHRVDRRVCAIPKLPAMLKGRDCKF